MCMCWRWHLSSIQIHDETISSEKFTLGKLIFGYRLCGMTRISENRFGTPENRWRLFRKPFSFQLEKIKLITLAAFTLRSWLRKESPYENVYIFPSLCNSEVPQTGEITEGLWRSAIPQQNPGTLCLHQRRTMFAKRLMLFVKSLRNFSTRKDFFHGNGVELKLMSNMIII